MSEHELTHEDDEKWTDVHFPFLISDMYFDTEEETADGVRYLLDMKPIYVFDDAEKNAVELYMYNEIYLGLLDKRMVPIYDCIAFFEEHYPKYDYKKGVVQEIIQDALIQKALLDPKAHGAKDLSVEEIFGMEAK